MEFTKADAEALHVIAEAMCSQGRQRVRPSQAARHAILILAEVLEA